jgi:hypothetical protein
VLRVVVAKTLRRSPGARLRGTSSQHSHVASGRSARSGHQLNGAYSRADASPGCKTGADGGRVLQREDGGETARGRLLGAVSVRTTRARGCWWRRWDGQGRPVGVLATRCWA